MIHGSFIAYGLEIGEYGMPNPYYSYRLWASALQNLPGVAVASIIGISGGQQFNRHVSANNERAAFDKAIEQLKALPEHHNLKINVQEE